VVLGGVILAGLIYLMALINTAPMVFSSLTCSTSWAPATRRWAQLSFRPHRKFRHLHPSIHRRSSSLRPGEQIIG
jgi:hypothetical protein